MSIKRIESSESNKDEKDTKLSKRLNAKKVLYTEIDDEVTAIYDRLKQLKIKNIYIVVPVRAIIFQSIVNLKILKRKAQDLEKNIYIITNDPNGTKLAKQVGLNVYDKVENDKHPSLVSGKFFEDQQNITPLKASVNTVEDETPTRQTEKKLSISELIRTGKEKGLSAIARNFSLNRKKKGHPKNNDKGKLVLIAPNRQALISLVIVSVIILLTITYIALPGATIKLTPKSNVIQTAVNITFADYDANKIELDTHPIRVLPSYSVVAEIKRPLNYKATGKDFQGTNASGVITIVNESDQEWPLIANTRFQTDNNLIFRSKNYVVVPKQNGDQPGTIDITVIADPVDSFGQIIGDRGNISPTKFFLPGLSAESQKKIFAESKTEMSGGKTIVTKFITKEDLEAAKVKMEEDLVSSAQTELQAVVASRNQTQNTNLVLLLGDSAIQTGTPKVTIPSNLENQKLDSFEIQGAIVAVGTAYNKDELMNVLQTELKLKKNPEKRLTYIDTDSLTYRVVEMDLAAKKVKITATIKGIEEFEISPEKENGARLIKKIKEHVLSKDIQEAQDYIQNLPEINKVVIDSWPAWAPNMPGVPDNIEIEIMESS